MASYLQSVLPNPKVLAKSGSVAVAIYNRYLKSSVVQQLKARRASKSRLLSEFLLAHFEVAASDPAAFLALYSSKPENELRQECRIVSSLTSVSAFLAYPCAPSLLVAAFSAVSSHMYRLSHKDITPKLELYRLVGLSPAEASFVDSHMEDDHEQQLFVRSLLAATTSVNRARSRTKHKHSSKPHAKIKAGTELAYFESVACAMQKNVRAQLTADFEAAAATFAAMAPAAAGPHTNHCR